MTFNTVSLPYLEKGNFVTFADETRVGYWFRYKKPAVARIANCTASQ